MKRGIGGMCVCGCEWEMQTGARLLLDDRPACLVLLLPDKCGPCSVRLFSVSINIVINPWKEGDLVIRHLQITSPRNKN